MQRFVKMFLVFWNKITRTKFRVREVTIKGETLYTPEYKLLFSDWKHFEIPDFPKQKSFREFTLDHDYTNFMDVKYKVVRCKTKKEADGVLERVFNTNSRKEKLKILLEEF